LISRVSEESLEGDQGLEELQFEIDKRQLIRRRRAGHTFEESLREGEGARIPRRP
jgi:hypothetical protein